MNERELPPAVENWLARLKKDTRGLPHEERNELVDGFRSHFTESLAAGSSEASILRNAGSPEGAARVARQELLAAAGADTDPGYFTAKRWAQIAASALSLIAYIVILLIPGNATTRLEADGSYTTTVETIAQSGDLGVLIGFALPFIASTLPLFFRGKGFTVTSTITALLLAFIASLAWLVNPGFFLFLPAAAAGIVAAIVPRRRASAS